MASAIRRAPRARSTPADPMRPLAVVAIGGNALTAADQSGTADRDRRERQAHGPESGPSHGCRVAGRRSCTATVRRSATWRSSRKRPARIVPAQPLHQLCGMTQGQLGGALVREIDRLCGAGIAVAVVTHVRVDPKTLHSITRPSPSGRSSAPNERPSWLAIGAGGSSRTRDAAIAGWSPRLPRSTSWRRRRSARCSMLGTSCWPPAAAASR